MLQFEVGKTYVMYAINSSCQFRAKCVSRTPKTATFKSSEQGSWLYMPVFTLRRAKNSHFVTPNGEEEEVLTSKKPAGRVYYGIIAYAGMQIDAPID